MKNDNKMIKAIATTETSAAADKKANTALRALPEATRKPLGASTLNNTPRTK